MRSQAAGHGKIVPRCVPEGASDEKNTGSRQHIAAMYSDTAYFGKICAPCIRKAPQSAVGECTARASCRQGALSPSEAPRSCTAHESCRPPVALPLRRGSCPSSCIAGSPFNGLALAQGCLPQRLANTRHPPIPATCQCLPPANACRLPCPLQPGTSRRWASAAVIRRMACSSAKPRGAADCTISTGRPTTECCAELGLNSKTVNKWAQNRRRRPQARPVLRQHCQKRPSKGRVPLGGTIGTPHPFPIAQKKPTPRINPRVSFICVLSCIQPVRVSSCFTLGSFSAGCRPFFRLAPAAQQRFGASKLAVASLQGTTFRQSASPARRLTLAARYWTSAFHRPCRLQYSYTATGSSPGTTAKSALGSSPG